MCRAKLFNQKAASAKSKPDEVLKALDLKSGQRIADIGSGGGYFSLKFARAVGKDGQVSAVDTNSEYLDYVKKQAAKENLVNIKFLLISAAKPELPKEHFDLIFIRNVYHHLENRVELMKAYKEALKPGGRLAIIEYKPGLGFFNFRRLFGHNVPVKTIVEELAQAGYQKIKEYDFLPEQSFAIFTLKQERNL